MAPPLDQPVCGECVATVKCVAFWIVNAYTPCVSGGALPRSQEPPQSPSKCVASHAAEAEPSPSSSEDDASSAAASRAIGVTH